MKEKPRSGGDEGDRDQQFERFAPGGAAAPGFDERDGPPAGEHQPGDGCGGIAEPPLQKLAPLQAIDQLAQPGAGRLGVLGKPVAECGQLISRPLARHGPQLAQIGDAIVVFRRVPDRRLVERDLVTGGAEIDLRGRR